MPAIRFPRVAVALCPWLLAACVGHGDTEAWTPDAQAPSPTASLQPRTHAPTIPPGRVMQAYYNLEISVPNPARAADATRTIAHDQGGEVLGLNADAHNGSVTVSLDPDAADRFRHALLRIPGTVIRENSSSSDITQQVAQLDDRLTKLEHAEAEMDRLMRATTDRALFDAWVVQRELNTRERESLHGQIASYLQSVRRTQFNVTFTPNTPVPIAEPAPRGVVGLHVDR
jgi:hypothetical protein